jgi:hypothetical protein
MHIDKIIEQMEADYTWMKTANLAVNFLGGYRAAIDDLKLHKENEE